MTREEAFEGLDQLSQALKGTRSRSERLSVKK